MIYQILENLNANSSRLEKERILKTLNEEEERLLKKVIVAALDPRINYYIQKYEKREPDLFSSKMNLEDAINSLDAIVTRRITGNDAINHVESIHQSLSKEDAEVFWRIIKRDLRCGVSVKTANKIWPNLINEHPYMRCSSFTTKDIANIRFPAFSQTKEDGLYTDIVVNEAGNIRYLSRSGEAKHLFHCKEKDPLFVQRYVFMGEALVLDESGRFMTREDGNGYLNSNDIDPNRICYVLWDMVPYEDWKNKKCEIPYSVRFNRLEQYIKETKHNGIRLVDTRLVSNIGDIVNHFKDNINRGKEGTVIKNLDGIWEPGTSKDQIKCKIVFECDLKIVGFKEGTGKHVGKLGSIQCESADGFVSVSFGSGFKDKDNEREKYFTDSIIGKIVTGKGNGLIYNKEKDKYSIFLPRFVEFRHDKTEADDLEKINKQIESSLDILKLLEK